MLKKKKANNYCTILKRLSKHTCEGCFYLKKILFFAFCFCFIFCLFILYFIIIIYFENNYF